MTRSERIELANRLDGRFVRLWTVSTVSSLGDGVTLVAGPLLATTITRDPLAVSGLVVAQRLPWLLFSLPSGALVDRLHHPKVMVVTGAVRAVALGLTALTITSSHVGLVFLYAVFFLMGCAGVLFDTTTATMVPAVASTPLLARANGRLLGGRTLAGDLLAAPLGGTLFAAVAWLPFALDSVSFVVVAVVAATLCTVRSRGTSGTFRAEIAEGLRWLLRHRLLRGLALSVGMLNLTLSGAMSILVLVATERFATGSAGYGWLLAALAYGGVVGSLVGDRVIRALGRGTVLRMGLAVEGVTHLVLAVSPSAIPVGIVLALFGLSSVLFSTCTATLRQALAPPELLGRVQSAYRWLSVGGASVGALLGGLLARHLGLVAPFWFGLAGALVLIVCFWRRFGIDATAIG